MNHVAEHQNNPLAQSEQPQRGFEHGVDQEDLVMPRAKLIQALSPEMQEGLEGIKVGSIINSLTKEVLPEIFIPIFFFKTFIRFNPRKKDDPNFDREFEPGAVIWMSNDPHDPKVIAETGFKNNRKKPLAVTFLNFFSYFPGVSMPVIVSFSKTGYKAGRQLLSLCCTVSGDMFSRQYRLRSQMESNDVGVYAVFKATPVGHVSTQEHQSCERLWEMFSAKTGAIQVHTQDETQEADEAC